jgi:hypothetical protein
MAHKKWVIIHVTFIKCNGLGWSDTPNFLRSAQNGFEPWQRPGGRLAFFFYIVPKALILLFATSLRRRGQHEVGKDVVCDVETPMQPV